MSIMVMNRDNTQVVRCTKCPDWRSEVPAWGMVVANHHNITEHGNQEQVVDRREPVCA